MFYSFEDLSIRFTGRWAKAKGDNCMTATAAGSKIELAFYGEMAVLHFNTAFNQNPVPHLWISVDGGAMIEAPVDTYLRVACEQGGGHTVTIIYKSAVEMQHRWYAPLIGKISFSGYEADASGVLAQATKKTIEFIGDSITEGVLIDAMYAPDKNMDQYNRPVQDDSTATYAYLTAKKLGLEPIIMGYGAVGATHAGCGSVPAAPIAYPFCFDGAPITHKSADYIVINHGTNDSWGYWLQKFNEYYTQLLDTVIAYNPTSKVVVMVPFCGAFRAELIALVSEYNRTHNRDIFVVDTDGWLPAEPIHPLRDGHKLAAEKLTAVLKEKFGI